MISKELMEKIDYIVLVTPEMPNPPLSKIGRRQEKPYTKKMLKKDLTKLSPEEIERQFNQLKSDREISINNICEYDHVKYNADFMHWLRQPYCSIKECVILFFGKDPEKINLEYLKRYGYKSFFINEIEKMYETAVRCFIAGDLTDPIPFSHFLDWAQRKGYKPPHKLLAVLDKTNIQLPDWKSLYIEKLNEYNKLLESIEIKDQLIEELNQNKGSQEIHPRTETSYQHMVGSLLEYISGDAPGIPAHPLYTNDTNLIGFIDEMYRGYEGLSVSNLSRKFPTARNRINKK